MRVGKLPVYKSAAGGNISELLKAASGATDADHQDSLKGRQPRIASKRGSMAV
jgi:hypothetical protein